MSCNLLFVYGTLRRGRELHSHLRRLGARFVGTARIAAVLDQRRCYPGARPTGRRGKWVQGELFALRRPAQDLRVLDAVEGAVNRALPGEFVRGVAEVASKNTLRHRAWVYWLGIGPLTKGIEVPQKAGSLPCLTFHRRP